MIPDRGHKKWTSLMIPEHRERLHQLYLEQDYVQLQEPTEERKEELDFALSLCQPGMRMEVQGFNGKQLFVLEGYFKNIKDQSLLLEHQEDQLLRIPLQSIRHLRALTDREI